MQITVKTLTGTVKTLEATPETSIDELKENISSKFSIPRSRQKIFYAGKQLIDGTVREVCVHLHLFSPSLRNNYFSW